MMIVTKEDAYNWLVSNKASIHRQPAIQWTRENGTVFYSDFTLCANGTQYPAFETLDEAIMQASAMEEQWPTQTN